MYEKNSTHFPPIVTFAIQRKKNIPSYEACGDISVQKTFQSTLTWDSDVDSDVFHQRHPL